MKAAQHPTALRNAQALRLADILTDADWSDIKA
jgi:hypothetical protein